MNFLKYIVTRRTEPSSIASMRRSRLLPAVNAQLLPFLIGVDDAPGVLGAAHSTPIHALSSPIGFGVVAVNSGVLPLISCAVTQPLRAKARIARLYRRNVPAVIGLPSQELQCGCPLYSLNLIQQACRHRPFVGAERPHLGSRRSTR